MTEVSGIPPLSEDFLMCSDCAVVKYDKSQGRMDRHCEGPKPTPDSSTVRANNAQRPGVTIRIVRYDPLQDTGQDGQDDELAD